MRRARAWGFEKMRSQGTTDPIEFDVYYREHGNARPITYQIAIASDEFGCPYILRERLRQRRKGQKRGWPFSFLFLNNGSGVAWKGDQAGHQIDEAIDNLQSLMTFLESIKSEESGETETIELNDPRKLGIASRILSMPWNRKKFGSSKKTKMGFPKYVEQMKIHL